MVNEFEGRDEAGVKYSFKVAYNATADNKNTHKIFSEFCKRETDDSYILGMKKLLENYDADWKYDALQQQISILDARLAGVEAALAEAQENKVPSGPKTFGGE